MADQVTIEVIQSDIASGIRGHCSLCPVALALRRTLGHAEWHVGPGRIWNGPLKLAYSTPVVVRWWIERFDRPELNFGRPFSFKLKLTPIEMKGVTDQ